MMTENQRQLLAALQEEIFAQKFACAAEQYDPRPMSIKKVLQSDH